VLFAGSHPLPLAVNGITAVIQDMFGRVTTGPVLGVLLPGREFRPPLVGRKREGSRAARIPTGFRYNCLTCSITGSGSPVRSMVVEAGV
jgi:hypothetical protein